MDNADFDQEGWALLAQRVLILEQQGLVTRTYRRLDPERQIEIVDAILFEAAEKSLKHISIAEVARRAGVAVGSMYQYFPNRQGMIDFAIELCVHYLVDVITAYRGFLLEMPTFDALLTFLNSGVEMTRTQQGMLRFYGRAAYQGDPDLTERVVRPIADVMFSLVRDVLLQAKDRGELRADLDVEAATRLVNALVIVTGDCQLYPYLNTYLHLTDETVSSERISLALIPFLQGAVSKQ